MPPSMGAHRITGGQTLLGATRDQERYCSKSSTLTGAVANQRLFQGKYAFDTGKAAEITVLALLFLDQIKREKGVWWMPWQ